jgi:preprotein translocase subunit SecA
VDLAQLKQLLESPQGEMLADFSAFCQERGVSPERGEEGMEEALRELHEEWLQTPRESLGGRKPAEMLDGGRLLPRKVETFRREGPKIGRNDPCPCGSGKKYKKCCGKAA